MRCQILRWLSPCLAALAVSSCGPEAIEARSPQYDGSTIDLSQPTIVGYFLYSQREVNNDQQVATTLRAFQNSMDRARPELERNHIRVVETYRDSITLRWADGKTKTYSTASNEDGRVGYHLFHPETTPINLPASSGAMDLVAEAHRYLRMP